MTPFCEDDSEHIFYDEAERRMFMSMARKASRALIACLWDGLFPNLKELLTPGGMLLVGGVAELVEMVRGGAPCARAVKEIVKSKHFLKPIDIEPLQAVLPHTTVVLG